MRACSSMMKPPNAPQWLRYDQSSSRWKSRDDDEKLQKASIRALKRTFDLYEDLKDVPVDAKNRFTFPDSAACCGVGRHRTAAAVRCFSTGRSAVLSRAL